MPLWRAGRKAALVAHVGTSVGWFGAVLAFLPLAVVAATSADVDDLRTAAAGMELMGDLVLVPLSLASLVTGVVQGAGTRWGIIRHHWVVVKLIINVVAAAVLLTYLPTLDELARRAASSDAAASQLRSASPLVHASGALVLLGGALVLSVVKPAGVTRYGRRCEGAARRP